MTRKATERRARTWAFSVILGPLCKRIRPALSVPGVCPVSLGVEGRKGGPSSMEAAHERAFCSR
jgi:hypothetical protein